MDRPEHVESDVARIESKIRRLRFTKDSLERWMKWGALLGLILGTGAAVCFLWASFAGPLTFRWCPTCVERRDSITTL